MSQQIWEQFVPTRNDKKHGRISRALVRMAIGGTIAGSALSILAVPAAAASVVGVAASTSADARDCYDTAVHGGLELGMNQEVTIGGPNFTSGVCGDINIKLTTDASFRTFAMACLETADGVDCPESWTLLEYDRWQILRPDVLGGTQWQLRMYSDKAETVDVDYTA